MANYDIRFVLRQAYAFIRQSVWTYTSSFTNNNKAVITATWDPSCRYISPAAKLVKDLKILLAYPPFDIRYSILHDGSLFITIEKSLTPEIKHTDTAIDDPRQHHLNISTLYPYRRKKNGTDSNKP